MSSDDFIAFGDFGNNQNTNKNVGNQRNNQRFHAYNRDNRDNRDNRKNWNRTPRNFDRNNGNNFSPGYNNRRFNQGNKQNYRKNDDPTAYFHPSMLEDPWMGISGGPRAVHNQNKHNKNDQYRNSNQFDNTNSPAVTAECTEETNDLNQTMTPIPPNSENEIIEENSVNN